MGGPSISAIGYLSVLSSLKLKGVYLVGGSIRDILLRSPLRDIDIAIASESIEIARIFADKIDGSFFIMDEENQVARVIKKAGKKTLQFDFASFKGRDIYEDLSNRDFTINAMATQISKFRISDFGFRISSLKIIDPYNGRQDLRNKIIRLIKPQAFSDDPLRMLRAIRLASDLDLKIEDKTIECIKSLAPSLGSVSSERVRDELFRIFKNNRSHYYISLLDEYGLLNVIIPEINDMKGLKQGSYHVYELWMHSLKAVEYLEDIIKDIKLYLPKYSVKIKRHLRLEIEQGIDRLSLLKFAALLHDTGKPSTIKTEDDKISFYQHWTVGAEINKKICRRLAMSARSEEIVCRITANHMRPLYLMQLYYRNNPPSPPFNSPLSKGGHRGVKGEKGGFITKRAMYRFFRDTRDTGIEVILLSIADAMATSPPLPPLSPPPPFNSPLTKGGDRGVGELKGGEGGFSDENYKIVANVARKMVSYFYTEYKRQRRRSLINGADLIKRFRLQPGPVIGRILKDIDEARGAGELKNKRDAINYVRNNLHKWIS